MTVRDIGHYGDATRLLQSRARSEHEPMHRKHGNVAMQLHAMQLHAISLPMLPSSSIPTACPCWCLPADDNMFEIQRVAKAFGKSFRMGRPDWLLPQLDVAVPSTCGHPRRLNRVPPHPKAWVLVVSLQVAKPPTSPPVPKEELAGAIA
mmetsp:Transcript_10793/g.34424  ORF Transcript_10793/g.34424 Transcript_10793/m.34424 type:complete len:149 (+) Transcript_10793:1751-2197(+)